MYNEVWFRFCCVVLFLISLDFTGGFLTNKSFLDSENRNVLENGCVKEIHQHCMEVKDNTLVSCLYANRNMLSEECAIIIEATTFSGACDPYARQFCSEFTNVNDITICLEDKFQNISSQCNFNLENKDGPNSLPSIIKQKYYERTTLMVTLCSFYLIICTFASIWTFYKVYKLSVRQAEAMSSVLSNSLEEQQTRKRSNLLPPPIRLSLVDVSYYSQAPRREAVFSNVSFSVETGQIALLIGSAAGRSQLLRLLSGGRDLRNGKLSGLLAVDDQAVSIAAFNKVMRGHRVVSPQDAHDLPRLTVWQTVLHAVLLRTPEEQDSIETVILKTRTALLEVDLLAHAHSLLPPSLNPNPVPMPSLYYAGCGIRGSPETAYLNVVQVRSLLIALALLDMPPLLLLDQMMQNELSAKEKQDFWRIMKSVRRIHNIAIVLAEASCSVNLLAEMDSVVIFSEDGQMVCSGDCSSIEELASSEGSSLAELCAARCGPQSAEELYDEESVDDQKALLSEQGIEMHSLHTNNTTNNRPGGVVLQEGVRQKYLQSTALHTLRDRICFPDAENSSNNPSAESEPVSRSTVASGRADLERNVTVNASSIERRAPMLQYVKRGYALAPLSQVWVLVSQAVWSQQHRSGALLVWSAAAVLGTFSISFACRNSTTSTVSTVSIDAPQRTAWALGAIVVLIFILEAQLLKSSSTMRSSGIARSSAVDAGRVSEWARVLSTILTDTPRALLLCAVVLSLLYSTQTLNPKPANIAFAYVCLVVGTCAWQAFVRFVRVLLQGHPRRSSSIVIIVVLIVGILLSGLVPLKDASSLAVRSMLRVVVLPALLIRALIVNDLYCCYITTTCNAVLLQQQLSHQSEAAASSSNSAVECADALAFTGDGWDVGNLGRFYLQQNGFEGERPVFLLFLLVITGLVWRVSTVYLALERRKQQQYM